MKLPPHRWSPYTLVYLRANPEMRGAITGLIVRQGCPVQYIVVWGEDAEEGLHWEGELTDERVFDVAGESKEEE